MGATGSVELAGQLPTRGCGSWHIATGAHSIDNATTQPLQQCVHVMSCHLFRSALRGLGVPLVVEILIHGGQDGVGGLLCLLRGAMGMKRL